MPPFDITHTNLIAVVEPEEVVLPSELDDDDDFIAEALPAPPRAMRVEEVGAGDERVAAAAVVGGTGRLALEVPAGTARMVVLALDAEGQVIASRDLAVETAITAELFLDLVAAGLDTGGLDAVDLHVRLTPELAAALSAAARRTVAERRTTMRIPPIPIATRPRRR